MRSPRRLLLLAASSLAICAALPVAVQAQQATPGAAAGVQPSDPWPQAASDVPAADDVRFGQLPNGLRYAIMKNASPPGQASVRVLIDAGSLMEREDQLGLAHFMEHMAFNGSTEVPEGDLTKRLERLGLAFGADTNASTGFDATIYQLDLPRTDDATVDESLFILRQMLGEALLETSAIDRERGIVLSEERTRATPGLRALVAQLEFLMPGQLVPQRLPIGSTSVLSNAPRERFVEFYEAYYRPERATVVIVGDFDVDSMESKVVSTFGDWTNSHAGGAEPDLGAVRTRGREAGLYVEAGLTPSIQIAWVGAPDQRPDTQAKRQENVRRALGLAVLNRRLGVIGRGARPPFIGANAGRSNLFDSVLLANVSANYDGDAWQPALAAIEQETRRIAQFGVTQAELDREITEMRTGLTNAVEGASTRRTPALANAIVGTTSEELVFSSPATDLATFEAAVAGLTVEDVNAMLKSTFTGGGPLVFMSGPTAVEGGEGALLAALAASEAVAVTAPEAAEAVAWDYAEFGPAGTVVERTVVEDVGATFVTFANGVRLTVKPTDYRDEQILVSVRVGQGLLGLPTDRPLPVLALGSVFAEGGLGRLTAQQLEEVLTGKTYRAGLSAGEDAFVLSGGTKPADLDVQMQVLAAYVTDAAWRPEPFERTRAQFRAALPTLEATTQGVFAREATSRLRPGDARYAFPSLENVAAWSIDDLKAAVAPALASGPIEIVIVGDVDVDAAIASVASTFGALPPRSAASQPSAEQLSARFPAGTAQPLDFKHGGRPDQALGFVAWPAVDNFTDVREARVVRLLADVLRLRLIEELREGQAVTYSPNVGAQASGNFAGYGYVSAAIEAPPEKLEGFFADVDRIAASLGTDPITEDELERARRPRVEALRRSRATNEFWISELSEAQTDPARLPALRSAESDLEAITAAEVQAAAAKYLIPATAYRITVTPRAAAAAAE
ncbi:MAG TPA: insulinase family protein [Brevundimonas sp.]|jgi:zinc protease|uniref:M16 family metallopeptidase n=1 Tax=Brevundimonas sp. TaxID=1871086 RepID=UPI002DE61AF2|nr:insulinase family protein [Brevundimonas sp.]